MSETRAVSVAELRSVVTDPSELKKGTEIADRGGLAHLARHGNKLFADAAGSGAAPYKTQIVFGDGKLTGRCSCMAARSRPYCKHAAALLVAWARTPDAFAMAEGPPASAQPKASKVKTGKVDSRDLQAKGVAQAATVLVELWQSGVHALAADRANQVSELAASLRELGLRRLSARTLSLGQVLQQATRRDGEFSVETYASLVADMWLTVRKLEKHIAGEALAAEHVETLIGKTWTKKDRVPIDSLDLIEVAFQRHTTPDNFVVRESRLLDVRSGSHFSEKQILPAMIAKRTPLNPSHAGFVLKNATGSVFPSFAPRRLDLDEGSTKVRLDSTWLQKALAQALPSVTAAIAALAERRRDVFAPPWVPILLRVECVVASQGRIQLVDAEGGAVDVTRTGAQEAALMEILAGVEAQAIVGDLALEGAVPCVFPLAVIGNKEGVLGLFPVEGVEAGVARGDDDATNRLSDSTRTGISNAAVLLSEIRDDLAARMADGASAVTAHAVAPLASRLDELSLGKQAEALTSAAATPDVTDRLDAVVKLYHVLGIAQTRLVGAANIDRAALVRLPTMPSVAVQRPAKLLDPPAARAAETRGELGAYERLYHVSTYYTAADPEPLLRATDSLWADGTTTDFVLRAAAKRPSLAIEMAEETVFAQAGRGRLKQCTMRVAKLTALKILAGAKSARAKQILTKLAEISIDASLSPHVTRILKGPLLTESELQTHISAIGTASAQADRRKAIEILTKHAAVEAIPAIRTALSDRTTAVRKAAALGLAALGDVQSLGVFLGWISAETFDDTLLGVQALGTLGDIRAVGALVSCLERGRSTAAARDSLALLGPAALTPLLDLSLSSPKTSRRAITEVARRCFIESIADAAVAWVQMAPNAEARNQRVPLALDQCGINSEVRQAIDEQLAR